MTTTRTLMGASYPMPGLHSKDFDQDMRAAGRGGAGHRAAATMPSRSPATRKYYDDIGYPGHVNCTDNFNGALAPYGVDAAQRLDGDQLLLQHRHRRA